MFIQIKKNRKTNLRQRCDMRSVIVFGILLQQTWWFLFKVGQNTKDESWVYRTDREGQCLGCFTSSRGFKDHSRIIRSFSDSTVEHCTFSRLMVPHWVSIWMRWMGRRWSLVRSRPFAWERVKRSDIMSLITISLFLSVPVVICVVGCCLVVSFHRWGQCVWDSAKGAACKNFKDFLAFHDVLPCFVRA